MPDEYLDGLDPDERMAMWRGLLGQPDRSRVLVAVVAGDVVGFATSPSPGEVHAMNLDPGHWGRGVGRVLPHRVTDALIETGHREAVPWAVPRNRRARALYESEGWVAGGGESSEEILGVTVGAVRYRRSLVRP